MTMLKEYCSRPNSSPLEIVGGASVSLDSSQLEIVGGASVITVRVELEKDTVGPKRLDLRAQ